MNGLESAPADELVAATATTCGCGARIVLAVFRTGRPLPVDVATTAGGNIALVLDDGGALRGVLALCTDTRRALLPRRFHTLHALTCAGRRPRATLPDVTRRERVARERRQR